MLLLARFFAVVAPLLSLAAAVPTICRPIRKRSVAGLSFGTASLGLLCSQLWLTYGLMIADSAQVATNIVWTAIKIVLLVAVVVAVAAEARQRTALMAVGTLLAGVVLIPAGATVVGVVAAILTVVATLPQVWLTLRSGAGAGLSTGAVALGICGAMSWMIYGMARGDSAVFWCSLCGGILNVVLLTAAVTRPGWLLHHTRRRATVALHLDAVVVRKIVSVTPTLSTVAETRLPVLAAGIRGRHTRLQDRLETVGDHAVLTATA